MKNLFDYGGIQMKVKPREDCPNIEVNKDDCDCNATGCERHGFCCACIEYHRKNGENLAAYKKYFVKSLKVA